jgi:hypothetical protein
MLNDDIQWNKRETKEKVYKEHNDLEINRNIAKDWVNAPHNGPKNLRIFLGSSHAGNKDLLWFSRNIPRGKFANPVTLNQLNETFKKECEANFKSLCYI